MATEFTPFNEMHAEFKQYVSGPWFFGAHVPKVILDGEFTASQLRQLARALDAAEQTGEQHGT